MLLPCALFPLCRIYHPSCCCFPCTCLPLHLWILFRFACKPLHHHFTAKTKSSHLCSGSFLAASYNLGHERMHGLRRSIVIIQPCSCTPPTPLDTPHPKAMGLECQQDSLLTKCCMSKMDLLEY